VPARVVLAVAWRVKVFKGVSDHELCGLCMCWDCIYVLNRSCNRKRVYFRNICIPVVVVMCRIRVAKWRIKLTCSLMRSSGCNGSKDVGTNNVEGVKAQDEYVRLFIM
jgi:hypothetical protein